MFILLLMLLAVAIALIVAGLVLSPRHQEIAPTRSTRQAQRQSAPYGYDVHRPTTRYGYSAYRDGRRPVGINRQIRVQRSIIEVERPLFTNVFASMNVGRLFGRTRAGEPTPWLGVALILIAVVCFSLVSLRTFFPTSAVLMGMTAPDESVAVTPTAASTTVKGPSQPLFPPAGASSALVRLSQVDPAQYKNIQEYNT
ncbi:MAG TPA: hypothetical protein VGN34_07000, partial [Ktedonobacteraceae bacterium]